MPYGSLDDMEKYYHVLKNVLPHQQDLSESIPFHMDGIYQEYFSALTLAITCSQNNIPNLWVYILLRYVDFRKIG
jgi:hypothetical protein